MSDCQSHHHQNVSNHSTEPHPGYTRGINVEQTLLNGLHQRLLLSLSHRFIQLVPILLSFLSLYAARLM